MCDNEDKQLTGNAHSTVMTKSNSKPFVASFMTEVVTIKVYINPELPRVKIIIVGDANTGKSCFLHEHSCYECHSQTIVSCVYVVLCTDHSM